MSKVNIPGGDDQFLLWVTNFASVATVNATLLNLSSGQTTALTTLSTGFGGALGDAYTAKIESKTKVAGKETYRRTTEQLFRATAKVINANGNISESLKANLGISVTPDPIGPVAPPSMLVATGLGVGANMLRWKRNGNGSNTIFMVEAMYDDGPSWTFVTFTTKTRFTHTGQTPGVKLSYRVVSQRDDIRSLPSNIASVYVLSVEPVVSLKVA